MSGVPRDTVLGPLLFSLFINDMPVGTDSQIRLFADGCVCYREIKTVQDTLKLPFRELGPEMGHERFQPVKCSIAQEKEDE